MMLVTCAPKFPCGKDSSMSRGDGRILLGDNTGDEAVTLRPIGFQCVEVRISAGFFLHT
jgi:hypothetical protein